MSYHDEYVFEIIYEDGTKLHSMEQRDTFPYVVTATNWAARFMTREHPPVREFIVTRVTRGTKHET